MSSISKYAIREAHGAIAKRGSIENMRPVAVNSISSAKVRKRNSRSTARQQARKVRHFSASQVRTISVRMTEWRAVRSKQRASECSILG
eukprot:3209507-Prymnesium_polylepis.1